MTVQTVPFDKDNPLVSVPGEPEKANKALHDYAMLGVARSFSKLLERYKLDSKAATKYRQNPAAWPQDKPIPVTPPTQRGTTVAVWSGKYGWQARCARWDELQREIERREYESLRREMRMKRVDLLRGTFGKVVAAVNALDPNKATWQDAVGALKTVGAEMRIELGDDADNSNDGAGGGRRIATVVIELPKEK